MIKGLFKWFLRLAILVVVLVAVLYFAKDPILRIVAEKRIRNQTGMEAQIGKFSSGRIGTSTYVTLENLRLYNTAEFGGTPFLDIPELHLEFDTLAFAQSRLHIKLARFDLAELTIVRNAAGQTNIFAMQKLLARSNGGQTTINGLDFQGIDLLTLSLGRARLIDLQDAKNNREIRVDLQKQIFNNVKSETDVYGILFMIWLRSGGNFSLTPGNLSKDLAVGKGDKIETSVRMIERPAAPAKK